MVAKALSAIKKAPLRHPVVILGVPVDNLDMSETLARIEGMIYTGQSTSKGHQAATVNVDFIVKAQGDPELLRLLQRADLATADGMPLVWAARLLGTPLLGRIAGADLVPELAGLAALRGFSIYLLGAAPGVAEQAAGILTRRYPGLRIVGIQAPELYSIEDTPPSLLQDIRSARPDILMVALGNPKQEKWIGRFGPQLNVPLMIGIGGSLDFIAGKTLRAPAWMQKSGLEWLYRLLREPGRLWKRYAVDLLVFSTGFVRQLWIMRRAEQRNRPAQPVIPWTGAQISPRPAPVGQAAVLNASDLLEQGASDVFWSAAEQALAGSPTLILNLEGAEAASAAGISMLVGLARQAREAGGSLWLAGPRPNLANTIDRLRLSSFFTIRDTLEQCLAGLSTEESWPARTAAGEGPLEAFTTREAA